jgi:hypothetical protein
MIDASIQHLDQEQFDRWAGTGSSSELPIFVVGMIRTGTTLVEQVLSSHPDIGGAGEQRFWVQRVKPGATASGFKQYASLPEEYLSKLQAISPGQKRVVDKMPDNFLLLGFLHRVFPEARIIYVSRHPVDTCLSIWSTPNRSRLDWANRKADIVFVQRQHERLAAHWRSILPPNRFLEVRYEELVTNQEPVSRRMIEFCGQEWHDSCLRPQDNPRAVSTPSALQVRRPMFKTSIERWRKYEPWLGEFADLLPKG